MGSPSLKTTILLLWGGLVMASEALHARRNGDKPPKARVPEVRFQAEGLHASECRISGGEPIRPGDPVRSLRASALGRRAYAGEKTGRVIRAL